MTDQSTPVENPEVEVVLRHLSVVRVKSGDVLVLRSAQRLSQEAIRNLRDAMNAQFPGHRVLVLEGGLELSVLRGKGR